MLVPCTSTVVLFMTKEMNPPESAFPVEIIPVQISRYTFTGEEVSSSPIHQIHHQLVSAPILRLVPINDRGQFKLSIIFVSRLVGSADSAFERPLLYYNESSDTITEASNVQIPLGSLAVWNETEFAFSSDIYHDNDRCRGGSDCLNATLRVVCIGSRYAGTYCFCYSETLWLLLFII